MYKRNIYQQLRLMIKPPQYIIQISQALATLIYGITTTTEEAQFNFDWQVIKQCLKNTNEILTIINDRDAFQKRCIYKNYQHSLTILNSISPIDHESNNETFQIIKETLEGLYLRIKGTKSSWEKNQVFQENQMISTKQVFDSKQRKKLQDRSFSYISKCNTSVKNYQSRPISQQTNYTTSSRSSSNKKESKSIAQLTETKNEARLNKILNLKTSLPQNRSNIKQFRNTQYSYNNSSRSNSIESIKKTGKVKNQSLIKRIKQQDYQIKWELDKEKRSIKEELLHKSQNQKSKQNSKIIQSEQQLQQNIKRANQNYEQSIKKILQPHIFCQKSRSFKS